MFYILLKIGLKSSDVDDSVRRFKGWAPDVRIPPLHAKLKEGTAEGQPKAEAVMRMTGSQMMEFTRHRCASHAPCILHLTSQNTNTSVSVFGARSIEILAPLLTVAMVKHPCWRSWVKLVEIFTLTVKHSLTLAEIELIDDLQLQHSALFDNVYEYRGLKRPKHHFLTHLSKDAWRYGPPRGYWCFGFEGFNKVIKAGAKSGNWKDSTVSVMRYWSMRSAQRLCQNSRAPLRAPLRASVASLCHNSRAPLQAPLRAPLRTL